ncbi:AraC family transcriptional regulator [Lacticaseibacillus paracasei]|uniref:AraC family transcriptional regulator n=1 Tax=Lacticaseibacillus paracasei TaxID=1597 RepID=UPI0018981BBC|nr:helix-turn-helix domain-containing protein [Lacticaseibacillus paracasei]
MNIEVFKKLQALTPVEIEQQRSHTVSDDLPPQALDLDSTSASQLPVLNDYFFRNRNIFISKHNRFAPYPKHTHQFLEINYMLRGHVTEVVNGKTVELSEGDVLLLDAGSTHSIGIAGKDDLLINILFRDRNISIDLLNQIQSAKSVLYDFLLNRIDSQNETMQYILFSAQSNGTIQATIDDLIDEYYQPSDFSDTIIQSSLTILIAKLIRDYHVQARPTSASQKMAIKMLSDIRANYPTVTLEALANDYAYNKNYLGNLFHQEVGKTFSQAVTEERLIHAREMIQATTDPISVISAQVGISNRSFFYHKYAEKFGHTPKDDRRREIGKNESLSDPVMLFK